MNTRQNKPNKRYRALQVRRRHEMLLDVGKRGVVGRPSSRAELGGDMPDVAVQPCGGGGFGCDSAEIDGRTDCEKEDERWGGKIGRSKMDSRATNPFPRCEFGDGYNRFTTPSPGRSASPALPIWASLLYSARAGVLSPQSQCRRARLSPRPLRFFPFVLFYCRVQLTTIDADDPFCSFTACVCSPPT
jgi:hypothetical protein